jgi:hypothetical protein
MCDGTLVQHCLSYQIRMNPEVFNIQKEDDS